MGHAALSSLLLSIWCHWKWNFISESATIALDRAHQDNRESCLQICLSCGTINHYILTMLRACFSWQSLRGVCTVNWLLQGSWGLWYAMLGLVVLSIALLLHRLQTPGPAKWEHHLVLLVYNPGEQFSVDELDQNMDQTRCSVFVRLIGKRID